MREEEVLRVVAVVVTTQHGGNLFLRILGGLQLRVGDIVVVDDTTILLHLTMVGRPQEVHLIAVAHIRGIQRSPEVRVSLVLVVSATVVVVQVEAYAQSFACIDTKLGIDVVFTVLLVAAVIVADVGVG